MYLQDFKNNDEYRTSSQVEGLLDKLDLNDPGANTDISNDNDILL